MSVGVGDHVRITAKMKMFGTDDVQNVYTYRVDTNGEADDAAFMTSIAAHLDSAYTLINGDISTALTYISVDGINITKSELLPDTPWPILVAGTTAGDLLPQQVAGCVFWPTIRPKTRTSSFIGGYTELSNNAFGALVALAITNLGLFGLAMRLVSTGLVVATKGSFNPLLLLFTPSGLPQVPARWRTQRRRRIGVGS